MQLSVQAQEAEAAVTGKTILLVEDDGRVMDHLIDALTKYEEAVRHIRLEDAGQVIDYFRQDPAPPWPDALLLDLMMPYREARPLLDGHSSDADENDTGLRLLEWLRREEREKALAPIWVAIITARSPFAVETRALELLAGCGGLYYKPFNTNLLEDDLMGALGVPSRVPRTLLAGDAAEVDDEFDIDDEAHP